MTVNSKAPSGAPVENMDGDVAMALYDSLPPLLRAVLRDARFQYSPGSLLENMDLGYSPQALVEYLQKTDAKNLERSEHDKESGAYFTE